MEYFSQGTSVYISEKYRLIKIRYPRGEVLRKLSAFDRAYVRTPWTRGCVATDKTEVYSHLSLGWRTCATSLCAPPIRISPLIYPCPEPGEPGKCKNAL